MLRASSLASSPLPKKPGVTISKTSLELPEGRNTTVYTVRLDAQPSGNVTITPISGDPAIATVAPGSLTFTPANWDAPQTVTVTSRTTSATKGDQDVTITHSVSGADYQNVSAPDVNVRVLKQQSGVAIFISPQSLEFRKGGSGEYTVMLGEQPSGDVIISPEARTSGNIAVPSFFNFEPTQLTFTQGNWNQPQTITVTTNITNVSITDSDYTITHAVSGADDQNISAPDVKLKVLPQPGITLSETSLELPEGRNTKVYTLRLDAQPSGDVTITTTSSDPAIATAAPASLTFTPANWDAPQTVTVTSRMVSALTTGNQNVTITHAVSGADYQNASAPDVNVTVLKQQSGVIISPQ